MNGFAKATFRNAIFAVILAAAVMCRAERSRPMENRFLFIIDTSSAMKSRTNGVEQAVAGLLNSDMRGEFRKGDTIGVWTYSDVLHSDFPMQVWSPENKDAIAADVLRYLRHQHYENRAHLEKVLRPVGQVMEQSDRVTLIFIYDGSEMIKGTEFDVDINELQKKYARQFRSVHMPMVTILAARNGQVFDYSINYPASMTVPHTAIALAPPPETNAPPPAAVAPPPTNAPPEEPKPPRRRIEIVMSGTNSVTRTLTQTEAEANNPPPSGSSPSNIVMSATVPPQPTPPAAATTVPVAVEAIPSNSPPLAAPQPAVVTAQPEPAPVQAVTSPNTPAATAPLPTPVTAQSPPPGAAPTHTAAPVMPSAPLIPRMTVSAPVPPSFAAVSTGQQIALFVIAVSLLTIAVVLVVFLVRRFRGDAQPSLISQSIDRGR